MKTFINDIHNPLLTYAIVTVNSTAERAFNYFGHKGRVVSTWSSALYDHNGTAGPTLGKNLGDGELEGIIYLGETVLLCPPQDDMDLDRMCSHSAWPHTAERLVGFIVLNFRKVGDITITAYKTAPRGLFLSSETDEELQLALRFGVA
jgi:hypothetical protein